MANIFTNWANTAGDWLAQKLAPYINDGLGIGYGVLGSYYSGNQRKQLKVKEGQQDDNVIINYVGLAVDRSVSRLYRGGVTFKLPNGTKEKGSDDKAKKVSSPQQEYINKVWDLNKKEIILYQVGLHGAVYGTPYFKICPDEAIDPYTNEPYPALIAVDPEIIRIKTDPQNMNKILLYVISYKIGETVYWEITARTDVVYGWDGNNNLVTQPLPKDAEYTSGQWVVDQWKQVGGGPRIRTKSTKWEYDFPPIIHWKNLPSLKSCYGDSDIDDAINVQDKSNFVSSNTSKIIKFHAHPTTIGTGFSVKQLESLDGAPNAFHSIPDPLAKVFNLEMQSDLASSYNFGESLRQSIFSVAREVDISSMADKIGALTNFGLQVLWSDAVDKNDTKRQLYGDAIKELNRRLLVLANYTGEQSNPGDIQWGNALPVNVKEELEADKMAIEMQIVDKETVANRYESRYGVKYEDIKKKIEEEAKAENEMNDNVGAQILKNFNRGKTQPPRNVGQ